MLRVKLAKLKHVCTTAFLPMICKKSRSVKIKIDKCTLQYLSKAKKSSDSKYKDEHYKKQMRIIEKCFGEKPIDTDIKEHQDVTKEPLKEKIVAINVKENKVNKERQILIEKVFGTDTVKATTAKLDEEKLTQKIDHIDETPHVEAGVEKVDGFNTTPKVLGHHAVGELTHDNPCGHEQINLDEVAKRCLGSPVGEIDKILLNELKNISRQNSLPLKVNFPTDDAAQKYSNQIFERKTKGSAIVSNISNTHLDQDSKGEKESGHHRFQFFQLDTVPIFAVDENGMDYKESDIRRDYSSQDKTLLLDFPAVLDPYGMQPIPFYEYVSKEKIVLQNTPQLEEVVTTETILDTENNAPMNDEVILQSDDWDKQVSGIKSEVKELEESKVDVSKPVFAKTIGPPQTMQAPSSTEQAANVHKLCDSDVSKLLEYKNVISAIPEAVESSNPNIITSKLSSETDSQCVLTSTTNEPTDSQFENPSQSQQSTSSMPNAYGNVKRSLDIPSNTAISANQNPDEYFELPKDSGTTFMGIGTKLIDTKISDNILERIKNTDDEFVNSDTTANDTELIDTKLNTKACDTNFSKNKTSQSNVTDIGIMDFTVNNKKATFNKMTNSMVHQTKPSNVKIDDNTDCCVKPTVVVTDFIFSGRATDTKLIKSKARDATEKHKLYYKNIVNDDTTTDVKIKEALVSDTKANEIKTTNITVSDNSPLSQSTAYATMPQFLEVKESYKDADLIEFERPLIDRKGPITHSLVQPEPKLGETVEAVNSSNKKDKSVCLEDVMPLSMLLKRVRERSRREINEAVYMKAVTKPEEANKNPCNPPLDKKERKTTLSPNPCKPKPKDPCKPNPCKPAKKDPCAKIVPFFLDTIFRSHTIIDTSILSSQNYNPIYIINAPPSLTEIVYTEIKEMLNYILDFLYNKRNVKGYSDHVVFARNFDPWIPIPSSPISKVAEKRPPVCPKHGCKVPDRPIPSNTDKPYPGMPKKMSSPTKMFTILTI